MEKKIYITDTTVSTSLLHVLRIAFNLFSSIFKGNICALPYHK